jgi:hypothetical protein
MAAQTRYLNTDLDLVSLVDLTPLAEAFAGKKWSVLHCELHPDNRWTASFEIPGGNKTPEKTIAAMLKVIDRLPGHLKLLWSGCLKRDFNLGFDGGFEPRALEYTLPTELLTRIASVGASVSVTIYAVHPTTAAGH